MKTALLIAALLGQQPLPPGAPSDLPPGHPPVGQPAAGPATSMEELVKKLDATAGLKDKDRPFELSVSIGHLYFGQGRYRDARVFFEQAVKKAEPARALYLEQQKAAGKTQAKPAQAQGCAPAPDVAMETLFQKAQQYAKDKNPAAAAACALGALHGLIELEPALGNTQFLLKDPAAALASYDRALALSGTNLDARYGRGALLLDTRADDVKALTEAKVELERVIAEGGASPRAKQARRLLERATAAIAAGGVSKLPLAQGPLPEHPTPAPGPAPMTDAGIPTPP